MSNIITIEQYKEEFDAVNVNSMNFNKEAQFAVQALSKNTFLAGLAQKNPMSLKNAMLNVSALGVSLNPALKNAYLVPRGNEVCLDISYMGLVNIAYSSGAVKLIEACVVCANDDFDLGGFGEAPKHKYNAFSKSDARGDIVGAYALVKLHNGEIVKQTMTVDEINAIRDMNGGAKNKTWQNFYGEMAKKVVLKRALKMVATSGTAQRLNEAVHYLNETVDSIVEKEVNTIQGEIVYYSDSMFDEYFPKWQAAAEKGDALAIIEKIIVKAQQSGARFTDAQLLKIKSLDTTGE